MFARCRHSGQLTDTSRSNCGSRSGRRETGASHGGRVDERRGAKAEVVRCGGHVDGRSCLGCCDSRRSHCDGSLGSLKLTPQQTVPDAIQFTYVHSRALVSLALDRVH